MQNRTLISFMALIAIGISAFNPANTGKEVNFNKEIMTYIEEAQKDFDAIPADRKKQLKKIALFVETKIKAGEEAKLTYICTHNSRRSHMSQLWAKVAADYYGIEGVRTYSGGTEATAFNPRAVAALGRAGFDIKKTNNEDNPLYEVRYASDAPVQKAWSKRYFDEANPQKNFAAVMTCSSADKNCPIVNGATLRIAIPYEDPKVADGTPGEAAKYDERNKQIATEMLYCFSLVKA